MGRLTFGSTSENQSWIGCLKCSFAALTEHPKGKCRDLADFRNSFVLFKCNMEEIKKNNNDMYVMLTNVYARLKNLIYEDIPKITWEKKFDIPNPLPRDQLLHLSPESFSKLKPNQDIRNDVNQWVEDTLFHVILRKKFDHSDKDKTLLYLYRLLAIKYRVTYPLKGESFTLDEDLRIVLESKICNAALAFFDTPSAHDQIISPKHKQKGAPSAVPASRTKDRSSSAGNKKPPFKSGIPQAAQNNQLVMNAVAKTLGVNLGKAGADAGRGKPAVAPPVKLNPSVMPAPSVVAKPGLNPQPDSPDDVLDLPVSLKEEIAEDYSKMADLLTQLSQQIASKKEQDDVLPLLLDFESKSDSTKVPISYRVLEADAHRAAYSLAKLIGQTHEDATSSEDFQTGSELIGKFLSKFKQQQTDELGDEYSEAAALISSYLRSHS